jgi:hypothetical protein
MQRLRVSGDTMGDQKWKVPEAGTPPPIHSTLYPFLRMQPSMTASTSWFPAAIP